MTDPVKLTPEQLISSTKLARNLSSYLDQAKKQPLFITRENEIEVVMLSLDEYRKILEGADKT